MTSPTVELVGNALYADPSDDAGRVAELLACCARRSVDARRAARIRALLSGPLDWGQVLPLALEHRVAPLLHRHALGIAPELLPADAAQFLRTHFERNDKRNRFLARELRRLVDFLSANGIPALAFRGPLFAAALYGHPALRSFSDLNLLVRREDILKARDCLASEQFRPHYAYSPAQAAAFARAGNELQLLRGADRVTLGLRWRLAPRSFSIAHDPERLWRDLQTVRVDGVEMQTLSAENLTLLCCIEGARNHWRRLAAIADLAELIAAHRAADWTALLEAAGRIGCRRALFLGLLLAHDVLHAAVPPQILVEAREDADAKALAEGAKAALFSDVADSASELASFRYEMRVRERWRDRVGSALMRTLTPSLGDWRFVSLPDRLTFLYYPLRPLRIALRVFRHLLSRTRTDLAPYVATPTAVVERMLEMAELGPRDVLYDIGCGDGRIVILAALKYGVKGLGVDIDPQRIAEARRSAHEAGVGDRVSFQQQDAKTLDFSGATVATMYLAPTSNLKFRLKLERELPPGARVVAHRFDMAEWPPDKTDVVTLPNGEPHPLYLWRIEKPARALPVTA
jgi:hypothetical protein